MEKFSATTTEVDNYLELLDKASFDPAIKKVVEEAKIYNELLATTTLSPDELNKDLEDMVVELNSQWGGYD